MNARIQITMAPELQRRARAKAAELGISFGEYIRRLVADDLNEPKNPKPDISTLFDLVDEGPPTDIARNNDKMIGEAVWQEYLRDTGRLQEQKRRRTNGKR